MSSRIVRPGSFWWEDLTYRATTAEPGILKKPVSRALYVCDNSVKTGSKLVAVVLIVVADGGRAGS